MRIAAVSDLHGHLPEIPECSLLFIGGDICPLGDHTPTGQLKFLNGPFRRWLETVPAKRVVACAGNHDFIFEKAPQLVPQDLKWTYLQDSGCDIDGLKIFGTPWQPIFYDWAFNADAVRRMAKWRLIPDDTQVLVLHGPPQGYGDEASDGHVGCLHLLRRIDELASLKLAIFGHIHRGHGVYRRGKATLANVSLVNERYHPAYPIEVFELDASPDGGVASLTKDILPPLTDSSNEKTSTAAS